MRARENHQPKPARFMDLLEKEVVMGLGRDQIALQSSVLNARHSRTNFLGSVFKPKEKISRHKVASVSKHPTVL